MGCWQRARGSHRWPSENPSRRTPPSAGGCGRTPLSSAAPPGTAKTKAGEHESPVEAFDSDARIWAFNLRLMRWGAALLVALEVAYFVLDIFISPPLTPAIVALHAGVAGFSTLVLALTTSKWFERNWRPVCFANLLAIYGLTLGLRSAHWGYRAAVHHSGLHTDRGWRAAAMVGSLAGGIERDRVGSRHGRG